MNLSKRALATAVPAVVVITTLWLSLYAISTVNRSAKQMQADAHAANASAASQTTARHAGF
jgi:hypothetical protein